MFGVARRWESHSSRPFRTTLECGSGPIVEVYELEDARKYFPQESGTSFGIIRIRAGARTFSNLHETNSKPLFWNDTNNLTTMTLANSLGVFSGPHTFAALLADYIVRQLPSRDSSEMRESGKTRNEKQKKPKHRFIGN